MVIGGHAVLVHGRPRFTEDIDITLAADPGHLDEVLAVCEEVGLTPLPTDVVTFVRETFVLPAQGAVGVRVDFIFSTTPYEHGAVDRAIAVDVGGAAVPFATPEDLILHKLFAGRPRDLEDVEGVIQRQRAGLDWDYLEHWAAEFATVPGREALPEQVRALRNQ